MSLSGLRSFFRKRKIRKLGYYYFPKYRVWINPISLIMITDKYLVTSGVVFWEDLYPFFNNQNHWRVRAAFWDVGLDDKKLRDKIIEDFYNYFVEEIK